MPALLLSLAFLLSSLYSLKRTLQGKITGTDPHCRKCQYNLHNLTSLRCPECGTDLSSKNATQIGTKSRRPLPILASLLLTLAASTSLYHFSTQWYANFDLYPWKLLSTLTHESLGPDFIKADKANAEFQHRFRDGKISLSQATTLVQDFIAWEDRPGHDLLPAFPFFHSEDPITNNMGAILKLGVRQDLINNFFDRGIRVESTRPPAISQNGPFPFRFHISCQTFVTDDDIFHAIDFTNLKITFLVDGREIPTHVADEIREQHWWKHQTLALSASASDPEFWIKHGTGPVDGVLTFEADTNAGPPSPTRMIRKFSVHFDVLPLGHPSIGLMSNPRLDAEMKAAFSVGALQTYDGKLASVAKWGDLELKSSALPQNVVFRVSIHQNNRDWDQGLLIAAVGRENEISFRLKLSANDNRPRQGLRISNDFGPISDIGSPEPIPSDLIPADGPIELILTPDPTAAAQFSPFSRIYSGTLRYPIPLRP